MYAKAKRRKPVRKSLKIDRDKMSKMSQLFEQRDVAGVDGQVLDPQKLARMAMITGAVEKMVPIYQLPPLPPVTLPQRPKKPGKPKLTNEVATLICRALERGAYRETACAAAGISESMFIRWLKMPGEPYETFRQAVVKSEAHAELNMLNAIQVGAYTHDPKHAITFLQMRYRKRWQPPVGDAPGNSVFNFNFAALLTQAEKTEERKIGMRKQKYIAEDKGELPLGSAEEADEAEVIIEAERVDG